MVDGERGELVIGGFAWELASWSFEDTVEPFSRRRIQRRPEAAALPAHTEVPARCAAATRPDDGCVADGRRNVVLRRTAARMLVGTFPTIVAAYSLVDGQDPIGPA